MRASARLGLSLGVPFADFRQCSFFTNHPAFPGGPFWGWNSCWLASCDLFWPWLGYTTVSSPGPTNYVYHVYQTTEYYGEEGPDLPQLFLKDGTILNVTDYWLVDDQLHFTMIEEEGGKPVEHVIRFDALDLRKTVDVNTGRGFRFMLRNEPFEQYLRDHPEGPPPVITPPHHKVSGITVHANQPILLPWNRLPPYSDGTTMKMRFACRTIFGSDKPKNGRGAGVHYRQTVLNVQSCGCLNSLKLMRLPNGSMTFIDRAP
jgi:hypothetical protein